MWGSSRHMWFGTIWPRICAFIPRDHILEIAPGHGRCTHFLAALRPLTIGVGSRNQEVWTARGNLTAVQLPLERFEFANRSAKSASRGRSADIRTNPKLVADTANQRTDHALVTAVLTENHDSDVTHRANPWRRVGR